MEILYGFVKYEKPKKGLFLLTTDEYSSTGGWVQKEHIETIIGETDNCFIYRLQESGHGEWVGDKVINHEYILPVGIHKSRLMRWIPIQLNLFE